MKEIATLGWQSIPIKKTPIKPALISELRKHFKTDNITLGDVAGMPISTLKGFKNVGKIGIQSCMDIIARAVNGEVEFAKPAGPSVLDVIRASK